jgi:glutathione S-transferase
VQARLYVIPGSHPSMTARLMLERKGIPYKRVDLMPVIAKAALKLLRFPGITVPALKLDGRRIQGSREIARELDRVQPDPPLFPADPAERASVEEAERFGDEDLQPVARRILWWALRRDRAPLESFSEGARLGVPTAVALRTAAPVVAASARINNANDETVRTDLAALPGLLTRVDDYVAAGTLGGEDLNAGDLQVSTCIRLLMTLDDLRPLIEPRPCGELALRAVPDFPGQVPPVLPAAWLAPLRSATPARA